MSSQSGMSLVEVLVGGVLAAIMIAAVTAFIAQGSTLSRRDLLLRRAQQELNRLLEDPRTCRVDSANYRKIRDRSLAGTLLVPTESVNLGFGTSGVASVKSDTAIFTLNSKNVPGIIVTARIFWNDGTRADSLFLSKIITYTRG